MDTLLLATDIGVKRFICRTFKREPAVLDRGGRKGVLDCRIDQSDLRTVGCRKDAFNPVMPVRACKHERR